VSKKHLVDLNLKHCGMHSVGAKLTSLHFRSFHNLVELDLAENGLGREGSNAIVEACTDLKIQKLNLRMNGLGERGAKMISVHLKKFTELV